MKYKADLHVHSTFSVDGHHTLREMCLAGIERGLAVICFTEHFDLNPLDQGYGFFDRAGFFKAMDEVRREFEGKIEILKGIEFGEPHLYPREFEAELKEDYDFILGSAHYVDELFVGEPELEQRYSKDQIFEKYYQEVLAAVRFGGFDSLAHFDFPKRYLREPSLQTGIVDEIIRAMTQNRISLEINTSSLRKGLDECTPDLPVIQKYVQAGFNQITIGSDAHRVSDVATGIDRAGELIDLAQGIPGFFRRRCFQSLL
jgi:histidinol-phosphatase (PHP family)